MIPSVLPTYNRAPLTFVKGEGAWMIEADGRRFLDLGAGIAVNVLGHANPVLVEALTTQANALWHVSNLYNISQQEALADGVTDAAAALPRSYIMCTEDRTIHPDFQEIMSEDLPLEDRYWMATGHSPFFANPQGLADLLHRMV